MNRVVPPRHAMELTVKAYAVVMNSEIGRWLVINSNDEIRLPR